MARDPITNYRARLEKLGIDSETLGRIEADVRAAVDLATEAAKESPKPPLEIAGIDVWADGGAEWRN